MEIALICFTVALVGCGFLLGALYGYNRGTAETERRWSNAVERGDYMRKWHS